MARTALSSSEDMMAGNGKDRQSCNHAHKSLAIWHKHEILQTPDRCE